MPTENFRPEVPDIIIPERLLTPCEAPVRIGEESTIGEALKTVVDNHGKFAKCYRKHEQLINVVKEL